MDYGTKNIGLACSDELGMTVNPLPSFPNLGRRDLLRRLRSAIFEHGVRELVVGIPYNMDGSSGDAARRVEQFMKSLHSEVDVTLSGVDERLSTEEALEVWRSMKPRQQRKYRTVDSLAAAFILERYLKET